MHWQEELATAEEQKVAVGFDLKWNVDITAAHSTQGKPAIVTIGYKTHIYISQVAKNFNAGQQMPLTLKNFLADP
jgi:hypothetical protein